ncbi:MAG: IS1595 family transposase [Nitrospiraceae bacterium]|nr:IS1595 family transposase [Nitrospiraceae bacterium]
MRKSLLSGVHLNDEQAAYEHLAKVRWPDGVKCIHCQHEKIYTLNIPTSKRVVLKCGKCRKQFSATVGTIFEKSHIPLTKWFMAFQLLASSKKGMSAHQLHRMLDITYKSAWFMAHRIRHVMKQTPFGDKLGGIVEADETYIGGKSHIRGRGTDKKTPVFALVERGGRVRSFTMPTVTATNLKRSIQEHVSRDAKLMTDELAAYAKIGKHFADHQTVNHSKKEYARGEAGTNIVEGYFSLLKRGLTGTYHHVSARHLHRYLDEFNFRYNARTVNDAIRNHGAIRAMEGKRLQYR